MKEAPTRSGGDGIYTAFINGLQANQTTTVNAATGATTVTFNTGETFTFTGVENIKFTGVA